MLRVGYKAFGRTSLNYGLFLCLEKVREQTGVELVSVSRYNARTCDVLLFSLFWWQHFFDFVEFLVAAGIDPRISRSPLILLGGFQSFNFRGLGQLFHFACVGDGEEFLPAALKALEEGREDALYDLPGCYWPGKEEPTGWQNVPFDASVMVEPGQKITRLEIARGCRYRCRFCALAHLKPYREGSLETVSALIRAAKTKRIALFAPDRLSHSQYDEIMKVMEETGHVDSAADVRMDRLRTRGGDYKGTVLFGMEGLSERLRKAVGKPMPTEALVEAICELVRKSPNGKKGVRFYLILDLPGEREDDYEAFTDFIRLLDERPEGKNVTLTPFANTFLPNPFTPLQWAGIDLWSNWQRKFEKALWPYGHNDEKRWKVTIAWTSHIWGPLSRLKAQMVVRGDERFEPVFVNMAVNKKLRRQLNRPGYRAASALLRFCEQVGIDEEYLCGEWSTEAPLPWELFSTFIPKTTLKKQWTNYRRIVGM